MSNWREKNEPGSGILFDLGAHLIDQALILFGQPDEIIGDIESQRGSGVDDYFLVQLKYGNMRVRLEASCLRDTTPRFSVHGLKDQFVSSGMDPQEDQLKNGMSPLDPKFGLKDGLLAGRYLSFYEDIRDCINNKSEPSVTPEQALRVIEIILKLKNDQLLRS